MVIKSDRFQYQLVTGIFSAEISGLQDIESGRPFKVAPIPKSLPLKHGFQLESTKTGKIAWYYLEKTVRDNEGDIWYWVYRPMPESVKHSPTLAGTAVHIFND